MKAIIIPALKNLRTVALAAALAAMALTSFGAVQHASADGGNTITFEGPSATAKTPSTVPGNHITFTAAAPTASAQMTLTAPVAITAPTADTAQSNASAIDPGN